MFLTVRSCTTVPAELISLTVSLNTLTTQEQPQCLLAASTIILTCNNHGYPRPLITFRKNSEVIVPQSDEFLRISNKSFDQVAMV